MADRDEEPSPLGEEPDRQDSLRHYYDRAARWLSPTAPDSTPDPEASPREAEQPPEREQTADWSWALQSAESSRAPDPEAHDQRVQALSADAIDLSGLPDRDATASWDEAVLSMDHGPDRDGPDRFDW